MIIKAWHKKTGDIIDLSLLGTKGYKSANIRILYKCDKCKRERETRYDLLKSAGRMEKQMCKSCAREIDPKVKKDRYKKYQKRWRENNSDYCREYYKKWRRDNTEKEKTTGREYYRNNSEKIKIRSKEWAKNNPEKEKAIVKKYQIKIKATLKGNLDGRMSSAIYKALRDNKNGRHWEDLVGYTLNDLIRHLESLFVDGMNWKNRNLWHIDHKRPISSFNYEIPEDPGFKECWSLDNLQPLWAIDNLKKHDRLDYRINRRGDDN